MFIQIAAGAAALKAANTHKDAEALGRLGTNGALLTFDFAGCATFDEAREAIRSMDAYLGGVIADSDEPAEILELTQLKGFVCGVELAVAREYALNKSAPASAEAIDGDAISQLHADQHTAINDSSNSNGADDSNDEELTHNDEAQEQPDRRRRNRGAG